MYFFQKTIIIMDTLFLTKDLWNSNTIEQNLVKEKRKDSKKNTKIMSFIRLYELIGE